MSSLLLFFLYTVFRGANANLTETIQHLDEIPTSLNKHDLVVERQRLEAHDDEILRSLQLTPQQQATLEILERSIPLAETTNFKAMGATVPQINKRARIGDLLYQSDMLLSREQWNDVIEDINNNTAEGRKKRQAYNVRVRPDAIWPSARVYYSYHRDTRKYPIVKEVFEKGFREWQEYTCVDFIENESAFDRLEVTVEDDGCWSTVGYIRRKQQINLGEGCWEIVENVMRHVENALTKEKEKQTASDTPPQQSETSEKSENDKDKERKEKERKDRSPRRSSKRRKATRSSPAYSDSDSSRSSRSRSRSPRRSHRRHRRSPPKKRARSSSSSSRGTYDDFDFVLPEDECPFACKKCHRGFYTIKELAEHEIRAHDMKIPCPHCDKNAVSITKLAAHMLFRHPAMEVLCHYCDQKFGNPAEKLDKAAWDDFRGHVYKEILKKKMYEHSSKASGAASDAVALRGVGRCPHGAAVKCKNFPNCPGAKCIYSHGQCRYDITCNKSSCPFDHSNRPRVCMACINDMKGDRNRRRY